MRKQSLVNLLNQKEKEMLVNPSKNELAKQVLTSNRNRNNVWRQAMASCGSKNSVPALLEHRVEGRRILNCKNPHILIATLSTAELWKIMEDAFNRPPNITFDRQVFLITKQLWRETVDHFYAKLKELAENCDLL